MAIFLIVVGAILVTAGARNTQGDLWTLIEHDFTGQNNFIYWFLSIVVLGALGYIKPLKPFSNAVLALVIVVLFLKNGTGFFAQFQKQIGALTGTKANPIGPAGSGSGSTATTATINAPISVNF